MPFFPAGSTRRSLAGRAKSSKASMNGCCRARPPGAGASRRTSPVSRCSCARPPPISSPARPSRSMAAIPRRASAGRRRHFRDCWKVGNPSPPPRLTSCARRLHDLPQRSLRSAQGAPMPRVYEGVELVVDAENVLGESVVWCDRRRRVYWTDIEASTVWEYDPQTGDTRTWRTPARIGSLAVCDGEPLLVGLEKQIGYLDLDSGQVTSLADVGRDLPETRVNDGRCDSAGNFVFGRLNDLFDGL